MNSHDIEQKINEEITKTEALITAYRALTKPISPDNAIGRVSRMDAINNKSIAEANLRQAEDKLRNLKRVFSQLGSAEFGICLKCKQPIPLGRILIRPESLFCVNCAH
jgi:DnaK suppressor protein